MLCYAPERERFQKTSPSIFPSICPLFHRLNSPRLTMELSGRLALPPIQLIAVKIIVCSPNCSQINLSLALIHKKGTNYGIRFLYLLSCLSTSHYILIFTLLTYSRCVGVASKQILVAAASTLLIILIQCQECLPQMRPYHQPCTSFTF